MDFGRLANEFSIANAVQIGIDTSMGTEDSLFALSRLGNQKNGCTNKKTIPKALACAENVPDGSCTCKQNSVSFDGFHWCMETIGGKVVAALGCLMQCPLKYGSPGTSSEVAGMSGRM